MFHIGRKPSPAYYAFRTARTLQAIGCTCNDCAFVSEWVHAHVCEWTKERAAHTTREHPHLRSSWPFNARMPRILELHDPQPVLWPVVSMAQRAYAVYYAAGAPDDAKLSDALLDHLMERTPSTLGGLSPSDEMRHMESLVHRDVDKRWEMRLRVADDQMRVERSMPPALKEVCTAHAWRVRTVERRENERKNRLRALYAIESGTTARIMAARRDHAARRIQRWLLQYLYRPDGPMMRRDLPMWIFIGHDDGDVEGEAYDLAAAE